MSDSSSEELSDAPAPRHSARAKKPQKAIIELSGSSDEDASDYDEEEEEEAEEFNDSGSDSDFSLQRGKASAKKHAASKGGSGSKPASAKKAAPEAKKQAPAKKATPVKAPKRADKEDGGDDLESVETASAAKEEGEGEGDGEEEGDQQQAKKPRGKSAPKALATRVTLKLPPRASEAWIMQCEQDPDLEGDIGAVGRVYVEADNKQAPLRLDLKGNTFQGSVAPCPTFMLVRIKDDEARIDTVVNHCFSVICTGSVLDKETLLEGQLDDEDYGEQSVIADEDEWAPIVPGDKSAGKEPGKPKKKKMRMLESADVAPAVKKSTAKKSRKGGAGKKKASAKASAKKSVKKLKA